MYSYDLTSSMASCVIQHGLKRGAHVQCAYFLFTNFLKEKVLDKKFLAILLAICQIRQNFPPSKFHIIRYLIIKCLAQSTHKTCMCILYVDLGIDVLNLLESRN